MTQLDHRGALRDLNKAANLRLWLLEQGRQELAADLARSFSSCAAALIELQDLDRGSAYLGHAIDIYSQLSRLEKGSDLAGELANNHAAYASVLAELGKLDEAVVQAGHAIDILGRRVEQGQLDHGRKLASSLALRGLIHQTRGQQGAAAQDFERTAAALALVGGISEAIAWQEKALGLVDGDPRREAQLRLDRYRAAAPSGHAPGSGL